MVGDVEVGFELRNSQLRSHSVHVRLQGLTWTPVNAEHNPSDFNEKAEEQTALSKSRTGPSPTLRPLPLLSADRDAPRGIARLLLSGRMPPANFAVGLRLRRWRLPGIAVADDCGGAWFRDLVCVGTEGP